MATKIERIERQASALLRRISELSANNVGGVDVLYGWLHVASGIESALGQPAVVTQDEQRRLKSNPGDFIKIIKSVRERTGLSLADAKREVDRYR